MFKELLTFAIPHVVAYCTFEQRIEFAISVLPNYHIYATIFDLRHLPLALDPTSIAAHAARPKFIHQKDFVHASLQQFSYSNTFCWSIPFHVVTIGILAQSP